MFKRIAICCLVFIFCCTSAHAVNNCIHLDVSIHYPGGNTSRSADLYFTEEKMLVVSDLFPSSYLSVPFPEGNARSEISFSIPEFSVFSETDLRPVLSAWSMGLHNENTSGFYSGDLFDTATDLTEGTCGTKDFILLLVNAISAITGKSTAADELPELFSNTEFFIADHTFEGEYRIYNSCDYFSLTGRQDGRTVCTLSFDLSDPQHHKILFGYADNGKNYYRYAEINILSDHEMQLLISFYTDEKQTGFRSVSDQVPVLFESWLLLLSDDQKNISFSGVIQPQNDLNNILITGELISGENAGITADIKFEDVPDSVISVNAEIKNQSAHTDALTELPFSELSDITLDSVFAQELSDSIISFYTSLLMAMPAVYVEKLINLY